jgi:hypothetical protein
MAPNTRRAQLAVACSMVTASAVGQSFACNTSGGGAAYNATKQYLGCYNDPSVSILGAAKLSTIAMTPQYCANWCGTRGFGYGGIEFGTYVWPHCRLCWPENELTGMLDNASVASSPVSVMPRRSTIRNARRSVLRNLPAHVERHMCKSCLGQSRPRSED